MPSDADLDKEHSRVSLDILCEDGPILAVNKPAGLLTLGAVAGVPTLERLVKQFLREKYEKPGNVYLGIPHRLDRPVSGVIVFARNSKAAARLAEQFRERQVRKIYWALVERIPDSPAGELVDWLLKTPDQAHVEVVSSQAAGAREARLRYCTLKTDVAGEQENRTLLEIVKKLADRGGYRGVTEFLDVPDFHGGSSDVPTWAADGQAVFYTAQTGPSVELFRVALEGKPEQLTKSAVGTLHYHPEPSPDGRWLVYGAKRDGVRQVFVMKLADRSERQVTQLAAGRGAMWPHWQPVAKAK